MKKANFVLILIPFISLCAMRYALCEDEILSPKQFIVRAWEAWGVKDYEKTFYWTNQCIKMYSEKAKEEQGLLNALPGTEMIDQYESLNAVGTSFFIQGEAFLSQGKIDEAKHAFTKVIEDYSFAQNWDPRGWFWSVKEKSEASLKKIEGKMEVVKKETVEKKPKLKRTKTNITIYDRGKEEIVDYKKYGSFKGIGTDKYKYVVNDPEGLSQAVGEGIYPNTSGVMWDPRYRTVKMEGRLDGSHWEFVNTEDSEANFYKWAQEAAEPMAVRMFYAGLALESSGLWKHAIKMYYAIIVHFPNAVGWTYFHTPWYISQVAIDRINSITRRHPEVRMELRGAKVFVENGFDNSITNDKFIVDPGELQKVSFVENVKKILFKDMPVQTGKVVKQLGDGKVDLVKFENGHWQMRVEGKQFIIKGIAYSPNKVGQSPDEGTLDNWMEVDYNTNGRIDGPYDSWVDKNYNNLQEPDEQPIGDFELLRQMHCNTIRFYHHPSSSNKGLLRDLYNRYGIMVIMTNLLGAYTVGSGASWYEGTDYENPEHKKNMMKNVREMVEEFKDEPFVLFWALGNENNYGLANNADEKPEAYYAFVNEASKLIKSIDRDHPVGISNGDLLFLDIFSKFCQDVDIYGANSYRGEYGFSKSFWENVKRVWDKPVMITEHGCPSYIEGETRQFGEKKQAEYLGRCWEDIVYNSAGHKGVGNSIGAVVFEWLDEWWKAYEPAVHDTGSNWQGPFPDGWNYEEWLGVVGQGDGTHSPFLRQLKKAYFVYKGLWGQ